MINKYSKKEIKVLKPLKNKKLDIKDKGSSDLEAQIEVLKKEIDTLKSVIDIKELETDKEKKAKELYFSEIKNLRKKRKEDRELIKDLYVHP